MRWKDKISRFWIFPAERQLCLAGRKRLLEGKMQLAGSKEGGCVILNTPRGSSKMEIPAKCVMFAALVTLVAGGS